MTKHATSGLRLHFHEEQDEGFGLIHATAWHSDRSGADLPYVGTGSALSVRVAREHAERDLYARRRRAGL